MGILSGGTGLVIRMRNNKSEDAICCDCGSNKNKVLGMYDLCVGGKVFTICDECNSKLLTKSLRADCEKNSRVKSQHDLNIIQSRSKKAGISSSANGSHLSINEALKDD